MEDFMRFSSVIMLPIFLSASPVWSQTYELVDLAKQIPQAGDSAAFGISPNGQVVGTVRVAGGEQVVARWITGSVELLDSIFGSEYAQAISDDGVIVGTYIGSGNGWTYRDGEFRCVPLPDPCGSFNNLWRASSANDVNRQNVFTGGISPDASRPADDPVEAYLGSFSADGSITIERLGDFLGADTFGTALNDSGDVVGISGSGLQTTALLFRGGLVAPLPGLGGGYDWAEAINDADVAAGISAYPEPGQWPYDAEAVLWNTGADPISVTPLGRLPGHRLSRALDVNNTGTAVGFSVDAGFVDQRAVLWSGGGIVDLNSLLPPGTDWFLEVATAVNDSGEIVGYGRRAGLPGRRAFLLVPGSLFIGDFESGDLSGWS
jgi:probable HAF family extracellular repeat protein